MKKSIIQNCLMATLLSTATLLTGCSSNSSQDQTEEKINNLISQMTLQEKIGQMNQIVGGGDIDQLKEEVKKGHIGSILNEIDVKTINELQRIAVEENHLGIPLIIARDVIHGFKTVFPIPLAQAATWNADVVKAGARVAAEEATAVGVRWTFAPMLDISRDARWGRIIESLGEDPYLASKLGVAMVDGFQGESLSQPNSMAACAKHFCGYGASEGGRDYNSTQISEEQLRNFYLTPFKAVEEAGCATFMSAFNDLNGIPCTANQHLLKDILRKEWGFDGVVVSDWGSVHEMINHGLAANGAEAAEQAVNAGVDIDMMGFDYIKNLEASVKEGKVKESTIDEAVRYILRLKFRLGLFDNPYVKEGGEKTFYAPEYLQAAKEAAVKSCVLLKNSNNALPLSESVKSVAVIGPMADAPHDQLGAWTMDGDKEHTITPLRALREQYGDKIKINYVQALEFSRDRNTSNFAAAVNAARSSDVVLFFAGEESSLTGEAKCLADITLPGAQKELLAAVSKAGKPIVLIILAGRPVEIHKELPMADAFLYAWHPGTMGGPAIVDLLFGKETPSGKLSVSYPLTVGQLPYYYNHKNTGRPAHEKVQLMDDLQQNEVQTSLGMTCYYLDAGKDPLYPFGYGLSYTTFSYGDIQLSTDNIKEGQNIKASVIVKNTGTRKGMETVQLYIRDMFASLTRPVKELKGFQQFTLEPNETKTVEFTISTEELKFFNAANEFVAEPGEFSVFIGGNSRDVKESKFTLN